MAEKLLSTASNPNIITMKLAATVTTAPVFVKRTSNEGEVQNASYNDFITGVLLENGVAGDLRRVQIDGPLNMSLNTTAGVNSDQLLISDGAGKPLTCPTGSGTTYNIVGASLTKVTESANKDITLHVVKSKLKL